MLTFKGSKICVYLERICTKNIQHILHGKQKCLENRFKGNSTPQKTFQSSFHGEVNYVGGANKVQESDKLN